MKDYLVLLVLCSFTLFNLQGTRRGCDGFSSLPQFVLFVKNFFRPFPNSVRSFIRSGRLRRTHLYYHFFSTLSRTFFTDPATFVACVFRSRLRFSKQLAYNTTSQPNCQPYFFKFFNFFYFRFSFGIPHFFALKQWPRAGVRTAE